MRLLLSGRTVTIQVRSAVIDDLDGVIELIGELGYRPGHAVMERQLQVYLSLDHTRVFVAESAAGELMGLLSACCIPLLHAGWLGRITALVIAERARRQAVGRHLVAAAEAWFAERGCQRLEVTSNERRLDAHAFYKALGYAPASVRFVKDRP